MHPDCFYVISTNMNFGPTLEIVLTEQYLYVQYLYSTRCTALEVASFLQVRPYLFSLVDRATVCRGRGTIM
jgi:hypothetical protein